MECGNDQIEFFESQNSKVSIDDCFVRINNLGLGSKLKAIDRLKFPPFYILFVRERAQALCKQKKVIRVYGVASLLSSEISIFSTKRLW